MITCKDNKDYDSIIFAVAEQYGVDPYLVKAVINKESFWDPGAVNPRDPSFGLMQVTEYTARDLQRWYPELSVYVIPDELFDAEVNIRFGTAYLRRQLDRYGNVADAIAAYNTGTAMRSGGVYVNQGYVDDVLRCYEQYKKAARPSPAPTPSPLPTPGPPLPSDRTTFFFRSPRLRRQWCWRRFYGGENEQD